MSSLCRTGCWTGSREAGQTSVAWRRGGLRETWDPDGGFIRDLTADESPPARPAGFDGILGVCFVKVFDEGLFVLFV